MIPISVMRPYFPLIKNKLPILPEIFKNKDRVYIPFEGKIGGRPSTKLRIWLKINKYVLIDYKKGLVRNSIKGSPIKIGKLLRKKNELQLLKEYENDPFRSNCKNDKFVIVLSRHPYDLLGMSYNRGWDSCFNLCTDRTRLKLLHEINRNDIIFYLCKEGDTNIQNPVGRLLYGRNGENLYQLRTNVYGSYTEGFLEACNKFLEQYGICKVVDKCRTSDIQNYLKPKLYITPKQFSLNWKERLEYFKVTQSPLAKHDKHHLVRYLYYLLYQDPDAKFDENPAVRFLYYSNNQDDVDVSYEPSLKLRNLFCHTKFNHIQQEGRVSHAFSN